MNYEERIETLEQENVILKKAVERLEGVIQPLEKLNDIFANFQQNQIVFAGIPTNP